MRSPALISTSSKAGCYAVLASLSGRYPPLEGRSPTCYSPVCHSTYPLRGFRVRLACVRHAASVDSEPGSNSQVKLVPPSPLRAPARFHLNAERLLIDGSLTLFSSSSYIGGSQPAASGELHPRPAVASGNLRRLKPPRHPLILDGLFPAFTPCGAPAEKLCLHVLSSFQRTDFPRSPDSCEFRRQANLTRIFQTSQPCQYLFAVSPKFPEGLACLDGTVERGLTAG